MTGPLNWRAVVHKYGAYGPADEQRDYDRGRDDALRHSLPNSLDELNNGVDRIGAAVDQDLVSFKESMLADLAHERDAFQRLQSRNLKLVGDKATETNEFSRDLAAIELEAGFKNQTYQLLARNAENAQETFDHLRFALRREPFGSLSDRTYLVLLTVAFAVELPLNALAFQLLNEVFNLFSIVMAAMFGLILLTLAHLVGSNWRHVFGERHFAGVLLKILTLIFWLACLGLLVLFISHLREQVFRVETASAAQAIRLPGNLGAVVTDALGGLLSARMFGLSEIGLRLAAMNGAIVFLASIAAFFHADPSARYQRADFWMRWHRRKLDRYRVAYDARILERTTQLNERMAVIEVGIAETDRDRGAVGARFDRMKEDIRLASESMSTVKTRRIAAYRQGYFHGLAQKGVIIPQISRSDSGMAEPA